MRGQVVRTARALDPTTRTLRTEIHLPNAPSAGAQDGPLLAGAFVRARLQVSRSAAPVVIPANALQTRKEGARVLVVESGRVHPRPVIPGRDLGVEVELLAGLQGGEQLVLSPPDDLPDGAAVTRRKGPPPAPARRPLSGPPGRGSSYNEGARRG